jgi:hypothetical protein
MGPVDENRELNLKEGDTGRTHNASVSITELQLLMLCSGKPHSGNRPTINCNSVLEILRCVGA